MDLYNVEIFRSKVGVRYFELMETVKGLTLSQVTSLTNVLKRMGIEYKIVTIVGGIDIADDIDRGFFDDLMGGIRIDYDD